MDLKLIERLARLMRKSEITELEVEDPSGGFRVRLKRGPDPAATALPVPVVQPLVQLAAGPPPSAAAPFAPVPEKPAAGPGPAPEPEGKPFRSPMVGTFYRAASPDAEPFVGPGSKITPENVLCIIEAMKVMNEIKAETSGEIVRVLVENGEPVEFGQPLFLIRPF